MVLNLSIEEKRIILEALALYAGYMVGEGNNPGKYLAAGRLIIKIHGGPKKNG